MSLATYSDLQASLASWLKRSDLTSIVPDLVALCEARIARDLRLANQVEITTLATVAGQDYVAAPSDLLEFQNLILQTDPSTGLSFVSSEYLSEKYDSSRSGVPSVYTIVGTRIYLGPTPDAAYDIVARYYKRFPALSATPTNWLLTNHPGVYLFGALAEAAPFVMDDERVPLWEQKYRAEVAALQEADERAQYSGSALRVKAL